MNYLKKMLLVAAIALAGFACVPRSLLDTKIGELDKANADLTAMSAELDACNEAKGSCLGQNALLLERLQRSGTNLSQLESQLSESQAQLAELERARKASERRTREYRQLLERFRGLIDAGRLSVQIIDGRIVVQIPNSILFPLGSYKLSEEGIQSISEITEVLKSIPDRKFQITGHTDNVPVKSNQDSAYQTNWQLSCYRALAVLNVMIDANMPGKRLSAAGYGEFAPSASNSSEKGRAKNRRTEIVLVPDVTDLPGLPSPDAP